MFIKTVEGYVHRDLNNNFTTVDSKDVSQTLNNYINQYEGKNIRVTYSIEEISSEESD